MLEVGQVVNLNNGKEYVVINKISLHNINYLYLITNFKPIEIVVATEKIVNGNIVLEEIKDNSELDYIMSRFSLEKEEDEFDSE